jgi:glycosyltransferase involved in cell wall biosynthesis
MLPFFTVIIPNYNHALFLAARIESILNQTFSDFELIILDDCSTDNSKQVIEVYRGNPRIAGIYYNTHNSGSPFIQWKKGIELAKGQWIWIAESDDLAEPAFLEEAVAVINQHPGIGIYYCNAIVIDEHGDYVHTSSTVKNKWFHTNKWRNSYIAKGINEVNEVLKFNCTINNMSAVVVKKDIAESIKNDLIHYRYIGDWYFYIKSCLLTNIYFNNKTLCRYRSHAKNFITPQIPINKIKKENFQLLLFLLRQAEVSDKEQLINFYCLVYLGFGWITENFFRGLLLYISYFKQDKKLALKVISNTFWYKLTRRNVYNKYPDWIYQAQQMTKG